jgi:HK97 family phage prohead protease
VTQTAIQLKGVKLETKLSSDRRRFEAYASTFGNVDHDNDVIMPGAFTKTIAEAFPAKRIKVLWQHNWSQPIGLPVAMSQDSKGLITETELGRHTLAQDAAAQLEDGIIDRLSIGFWIPAGKSAQRPDGVREIAEVALLEYSLVTFPANDQAIVTGMKALQEMAHFLKSTGAIRQSTINDCAATFAEIKALLTIQPVMPLDNDQSRQQQETEIAALADLLKSFKPS